MKSIKELIQSGELNTIEIFKTNKDAIEFYENKKYFMDFFERNRKNHFKVFTMLYILWENDGIMDKASLIDEHMSQTGLDEISSENALNFLIDEKIVLKIDSKVIMPKEVYDYFTKFYQSVLGISFDEITQKTFKSKISLDEKEIRKYLGLIHEPSSEEEVKFLFFRLLENFKIVGIERIETQFPDAIVVIKDGEELKRIYIEFELNSSSFIQHKHLEQMKKLGIVPEDLWIVCWKNDALTSIPKNIKVIELKKYV
jgi:hypothetical protein